MADVSPKDLAVAWIDGVPVISEVKMMGDGHPSIVVHTKEESLQIMWARIEAVQTATRSGTLMPDADKGGRMRPPGAPHLGDKFRDWRNFTDRVCRPWIDNDLNDPKAESWYRALFLQMTPDYLATALVLADNALRRYEALVQVDNAQHRYEASHTTRSEP